MRIAFPSFSLNEIKRDFPLFALLACAFGDKKDKRRVEQALSALANTGTGLQILVDKTDETEKYIESLRKIERKEVIKYAHPKDMPPHKSY